MKAIMVMFDSLNRHLISTYGCNETITPNFARLAKKSAMFTNFYAGSLPCMPARRELHTARYNFLHRAWGPLEGYDDSAIRMLREHGVYTHICTDHWHYWEEGGAYYWNQYNTYELIRGQEGDPWKGVIGHQTPKALDGRKDNSGYQEYVNREYMKEEKNQCISVTFRKGLEFLETNKDKDNWFLTIESYDPHEPFFTQDSYKKLYPHDYEGPMFDWPSYHPVHETKEQIAECRYNYYALLTQCDANLGKVLDAMDRYDMWKDTMLIVNTDHGFLLSEHDWWGKIAMPYWNELSHIPFYLHNPLWENADGTTRDALAQTIDIAPTLLEFFGINKTKDMLGRSLNPVLEKDQGLREYALFGQFGLHINITDGRYVYMRSIRSRHRDVMPNYMLEAHSYPDAVTPEVLQSREEGRAFSFSKGVKIPCYRDGWFSSFLKNFPPKEFFDNDLLYDTEKDPGQLHPFHDREIEERMARAMVELMKENDAPEGLYVRMGFADDGLYTVTGDGRH